MFEVKKDAQMVEKALLVGVQFHGHSAEDTAIQLEELAELLKGIGIAVADALVFRVRVPNPSKLIGSGQASEVIALAKQHGCEAIVFDEALSPAQQRNWEREAGMLVIDRHEVILDIFNSRAMTKEAKLQVELAQMEYSLPRLRKAWSHLGRQRGGGVTQRGEGETQLELDQRLIRQRIAKLKKELEEVVRHRKVQRTQRVRVPLPTAAIIGYTNAGKSSLLNHLTEARVLEADQLFATLDPTSRRLKLPSGQILILTDTVGFIRKLPHRLVDAFKATLEEAVVSDLLLHMVDASQALVEPYIETTLEVLRELGAEDRPRLLIFNKADLIEDPEHRAQLQSRYPDALFTSTRSGEGLDALKTQLDAHFALADRPCDLLIPHDRYDLLNQLHEAGAILKKLSQAEGTYLSASVPPRLQAQTLPFQITVMDPELRKLLLAATRK
jgi:GTP-binding protein HflX